ncbi:MAG: phosphonate ABC transporter, permease protein PhnE [Trueperaceae bacterium]|nr:MAG: phosphonate ABC transporter, permease protein PhnE [Trueperaceae bacterium]
MLIYTLVGAGLALLLGLANSSMRRLMIAGSVGLIITFFTLPFGQVSGFLSRETVRPTLFGFLPIYPLFSLILVAALLSLAISLRGRRIGGTASLTAGLTTLILALSWAERPTSLASLLPLYGLMEAVTGIAATAIIVGISWGIPRARLPGLLIGIALGTTIFFGLTSNSGQAIFPKTPGYYKLLTSTPSGTETSIIESYNSGLEELNRQRRSIGLNLLEPITTITGLEGQRIPREAAEAGFRLVEPNRTAYGTTVTFLLIGLMVGGGLMAIWRPRLQDRADLSTGTLLAIIICTLTPAFAATNFSFNRLVEGWPFLLDFLDRAWPPNVGALQEVASQMLITIEIALVGTFLAAVFAVPLSFLASRNLTFGNPLMRAVFGLTRGFFNLDRGIDTLILALVFVAAVGLGPFAGVLAMAIHSIADLGKVYSESIENVDRGPIEALEAVGASGTNVVRWAILPQVGPLFIAWTLYRFEINFRVSIVLGLVGAGGIGFFIQEKMGTGTYNQMIVAILAIILVVNIIDFASSWLRGRLV